MGRAEYLTARITKEDLTTRLIHEKVRTEQNRLKIGVRAQRAIQARRGGRAESKAPQMAEEMLWRKAERAGDAYRTHRLQQSVANIKVDHPIPHIKVPDLDLSRVHNPVPSKKLLIGSAALGGAIGGASVYRKQRAERKLKGG